MPELHGFDVYHGNGTPAFPWADMVRKYGITLGCCKVSQGTSFVDPTWQNNRAAMHAAGLRSGLRSVGMYHWLSPNVPLDLQLRNFQRIGALNPGEFVMLDLEDKLTKQECLDACAMWEAAYPGRFIRYSGKFFLSADTDAYAAWPWWLAYYGPQTIPATHMPVTVWQWGGATLGVEHFDSNQIISRSVLERISGYAKQDGGIPIPTDGEWDMLDGVVKNASDGTFWARGVDEHGQWSCLIQEIGLDWNLYAGTVLTLMPDASLQQHHRLPTWPVSVIPPVVVPPYGPVTIDYAALANAVADEMSRRMAA